ncbi:MAG TPA: hypothetical protein VIV57_02055, partial [Anaeromyxobacter sp.]
MRKDLEEARAAGELLGDSFRAGARDAYRWGSRGTGASPDPAPSRDDPEALQRPAGYKPLLDAPASTVTFLVGNGEATALATWKALRALGASNLCVVDGGINRWLERYPLPDAGAEAGRGGQLVQVVHGASGRDHSNVRKVDRSDLLERRP